MLENQFIDEITQIAKPGKYLRWWKIIVINALIRAPSRDEALDILGYVEGHHIVPRWMGGLDDLDNIVYLTPREHIIVHQLMTKFLTGVDKTKALYAFRMMVFMDPSNNNERRPTARQLAAARIKLLSPPPWAKRENLIGLQETDDVLAARFETSVGTVCKWRKILDVPVVPRPGRQKDQEVSNSTTNRTRRWRERNRDKHNTYMREYRSAAPEQMLGDPDEIWFEKDPRKRKLLKQATPKWVDNNRIRAFYAKAADLNRRYPDTGFVVHHVIPISHPKVCGLHVPENLQVVSRRMKAGLGRKFVLDTAK